MRIILQLVLSICLFGCASPQQQKASMDAWSDCVMRAVERMDDGRTDPMSMAYGIAPMCAALYNEVGQSMMSGMITERGRANMRAEVREGELRMITAAILSHRARAR